MPGEAGGRTDASEHAYFQGKDNVVFHTVIWPAILLGYGTGGEYGAGIAPLELPDNVIASEFLTMEGKQFSTSREHSIYVGDFLDRYDPDPLRYYLVAAGPETQDTDFTWAEFVRRNNDELLANWGNLVNRTLTNAHRNFGRVPEPGELAPSDEALLAVVDGGFAVGRRPHRSAGASEPASPRRCGWRRPSTSTSREQAPWALVKTDRARAGTVLYVALRAVDSLKTMFTPFLPHTSQVVHELLGNEGVLAGPLEFREVAEEDGRTHQVLTGDYASWVGRWEPSALRAGQQLAEPRPLFRKLDESIVDEELRRMADGDEQGDRHPRASRRRRVRGARPGARRRRRSRWWRSRRRSPARGRRSRSPTRRTACTRRSASTPTRPRPSAPPRSRSCVSCSPIRRSSRSGRPASTTSGTTRRTTRSAGCSRRSWRSPPRPASPWSSTRGPPTRTRSPRSQGTRGRSCCTASRPRRYSPSPRVAGGTCRSPGTSPTRTPTSCARRPGAVPADRLLAETDSPYLAPQPVRGRRNEPAFVVHTYRALAEARGVEPATLTAQIDANADAVFGL